MATEVEVVSVGEGLLGIELPTSVLDRLNVGLGDELLVTEIPVGIQLSPVAQDNTTKVFRRIMRENRDVLKRLADS
jgi:hypothetical protein